MIIIDFLSAFGSDFAHNFLTWNGDNFYVGTLLLLIAFVLVAVIKHFVFGR